MLKDNRPVCKYHVGFIGQHCELGISFLILFNSLYSLSCSVMNESVYFVSFK